MDQIIDLLGLAGTIGIGLGLICVLLLMVIAARMSRVNDLLDEIADLLAPGDRQGDYEQREKHENQPA